MNRTVGISALACALAGPAFGQGLPTSQPNFLQIYREEVKIGHVADHVKTEAGWPAAFEKANSPDHYLALASITGPNEVWFVSPFESNAAIGESMKRESENAVLSARLEALSRADAEHLTGIRVIQAMARKDLSYGAYPDTGKERFWQITVVRMKPGQSAKFETAAKTYGAAAKRSAPDASWRIYQVTAGLPGTNFLIFSSFKSFGELDKMMADGQKIRQELTAEERDIFQKFEEEGILSTETQRFRLDPEMSYVPKDVRKQDPAFWNPKRATATPTTAP